MYVDFDPERHEGRRLYEMQSERGDDGRVKTRYVESEATFEEAEKNPYFYLVREEEG